MSFNYKNPQSAENLDGNLSVLRNKTFGTHFSVLGTGGYMEVWSLEDLNFYTGATAEGKTVELSANTIPIEYYASNLFFAPNSMTLQSDGISSGRRRLGMLVYVHETDKVYQYHIPNYESLYNEASGSTTNLGDAGIRIEDNTVGGKAFIDAWLDSSIEGVSGATQSNARWRIFWGTDWQVTGGTVNYNSTGDLSLNSNSGNTVTISGLKTITGGTFFSGTSTLSLYNNLGDSIDITGFTGGQSGTSGTSGSSGTSGISGTSGSSGTSGTSGTSGSSGTSGISGTSGSSGTSGISGTSGSSGTSGTSGVGGVTLGGEGIEILGSGSTQVPYTANTIYNTTLRDISMPEDIGGLPAGTTVDSLTGKSFVDLFNDILFPTVLPTYTLPTIQLNGLSNKTLEVGTTEAINVTAYAKKNDAGDFTSLRIRTGTTTPTFDAVVDNSPTPSKITDIPNQFGENPNSPNSGFTSTALNYNLIIPEPDPGDTNSLVRYDAEGDCNAGLPKLDNKGNTDTRTAGTSVNTPQQARIDLNSSDTTITGVFPYWYGTSATQPSISDIQDAISGGTANKSSITNDQDGTLTITFNADGEYLWFAHFEEYNTKRSYFVTDLNKEDFCSSCLFNTFVTGQVDSPDGYWSGINYKIYITNIRTTTTSFGSMELRTTTV